MMNRECLTLPAVAVILLLGLAPVSADDLSDQVRGLTGRPTRLVWSQAVNNPGDAYAQSPTFRLLGYDTESSSGPRPILPEVAGYTKPLLTPDGSRVVFSNRRENTIYLVNWNGSDRRKLTNGVASHVWKEPAQRRRMALRPHRRRQPGPTDRPPAARQPERPASRLEQGQDRHRRDSLVPHLRRRQDRRRRLPLAAVRRRRVCPTAAGNSTPAAAGRRSAPDNSYRMFVFQGNHRAVSMFDKGGKNKRTMAINKAPDINGRDVYHPRLEQRPPLPDDDRSRSRRPSGQPVSWPLEQGLHRRRTSGSRSPATTRETSTATPGSSPTDFQNIGSHVS